MIEQEGSISNIRAEKAQRAQILKGLTIHLKDDKIILRAMRICIRF